jgi:hypothetical protein
VVVPPVIPNNIKTVSLEDSLTQTNVSVTFTQETGGVFADKRNKVCFFTVKDLPQGWKVDFSGLSFAVSMNYGKNITNFFEQDSIFFENFRRGSKRSTQSAYTQYYSGEFTENRDFPIEIHTKNFDEDREGIINMSVSLRVEDENNELITSKVMKYLWTAPGASLEYPPFLLFKKKN